MGTQVPAFVINRPDSGWTAVEYAVPVTAAPASKTAWSNGYDTGVNTAQWGEGYESGKNGHQFWNTDDYHADEGKKGVTSWGPEYHTNQTDSANRPMPWNSMDYDADGKRDLVHNSSYQANTDMQKLPNNSSQQSIHEQTLHTRVPIENATYAESTESTL